MYFSWHASTTQLIYFVIQQFPLDIYPVEHFDKLVPKQFLKDLQAELTCLSDIITERNSKLKVPYIYMNPAQIKKKKK